MRDSITSDEVTNALNSTFILVGPLIFGCFAIFCILVNFITCFVCMYSGCYCTRYCLKNTEELKDKRQERIKPKKKKKLNQTTKDDVFSSGKDKYC